MEQGTHMSGPTQQELQGIFWWHSMQFPNGVLTPGQKTPAALAVEAECVFKYPVNGKRVLDIGAWNGFFTFEAARRGAAEVTGLDNFVWSIPQYKARESFELARTYIDRSVKAIQLDVMDITPERVGTFDVVFFLGVLYHLKHPLYALELLSNICLERVVIETHMDATDIDRPMMAFYPGDELVGDPTNWVGPNQACVEAMLRTAGFNRVECIPHPAAPASRAFFHAWK